MFRRLDVLIGLITSALGVIGVGFAVFGPATYSYGTDWMSSASVSLWEQGLNTGSVLYLAIMLVLSLAVAAGAYLHSRTADSAGIVVLWVAAVALFIGAVVTLPGNTTAIVSDALHTDTADTVGIGIYFIPAAVMAFVTTIASIAMHHASSGPVALRQP